MYFNRSMGRVEEDIEAFSLKALTLSKGKTARISEVTPILFEDGQEVRLKKVYKEILDEFKTQSRYKKYFSVWIVVGASWNIPEHRYYYMIRNRFIAFVWVTEDQIEPAGLQTKIVEGPERYVQRAQRNNVPSWVPGQQSLDPKTKDWTTGSCDMHLRERLRQRRK